jgi:diadenosine tetraphosphate (Ap4A) HIT family hydrolase
MSSNTFELDQRLEQDSVLIGALPLCQIRLMNDCQYPWLILVPQVPETSEIIDLSEADQATLMLESALTGQILTKYFGPGKLNVAALGNVVNQLHIHYIMRYTDDAAWPAPVWGVKPMLSYEEAHLQDRVSLLKEAFFGQN